MIRYGVIIEARMNSSRLPGKVLKKVLGKSLLEFMIERIKKAKFVDEIIVSTTTKKNDDQIVKILEKSKVKFYRGSENDVLDRFYTCATFYLILLVLVKMVV